ncbi:MAG: dockerin type I repeat-containing protein [bacterium]
MTHSKLRLIIYACIGILVFLFFLKNIFHYSKASGTTVQFTIKVQGTYNLSRSIKARIELYNQKEKLQTWNDVIFSRDSRGIYTGEITLSSFVDSHFYAFTVKPDKSLQQLVCDYQTINFCGQPKLILKQGQNSIDMTQSIFYVGDVNNDGKIDSFDMSTVLKYLGKEDKEALNHADCNQDNVVDTTDYASAIKSMSLNAADIYPLWIGTQNAVEPTITPSSTQPTSPSQTSSHPTNTPNGVSCKISLHGSIRVCKFFVCGSQEYNEQQTQCVVPAYCNKERFYSSMKDVINKEVEKGGYTVDWSGSTLQVETVSLSPC